MEAKAHTPKFKALGVGCSTGIEEIGILRD